MNASSFGVPLVRATERGSELVHLTGAQGCAAALFAHHRRRRYPTEPVVMVCADDDAAEHVKSDLMAFSPAERIVFLPHPEASPYDPIRPDRSVAQARSAALTLIDEGRWDYLVCTATAWIRRCMHPDVVRARTTRLELGQACEWSDLERTLTAAGYQRMPLTEDPGSLSVRGDILDIWPPTSDLPLRIELSFDRVERITLFDPETQRTLADAPAPKEALLGPTREFLAAPQHEETVSAALRKLCDDVGWPSTRSRALIDEVQSGRMFMGAHGYLPAFGPPSFLHERLPPTACVVFDDAARVVEIIEEQLEQAEVAYQMRGDDPHFPPNEHFLLDESLDESIERPSLVALHPQALSGPPENGFRSLVHPPLHAPSLEMRSQTELRLLLARTRKEKGRDAGLGPLLSQIETWKEDAFRVVISTRNETQLNRLSSLLTHRGLETSRAKELLSPATTGSDRSVELCVSPLSRGIVASCEGLVLITEEEIFGSRKHNLARRASRAIQNALDDLRSLSPGDSVVHVEHGIGRYLGLEHRKVGEIMVELLVVEYAAGDRLLLPVYRLNQIQKYSGEGTPKLDRLGGTTFEKTKAKAKKRVRILADHLLRLYAERRAVQRPPVSPPDDDFAEFEAAFPYEETSDQAAAIADVVADLQKEQVMDRLVCGDVGFGKTEVAMRAAYLVAREGRQVALLCPTTVLAEQHLRTVEQRFGDSGLSVAALSRFVPKKKQEQVLADLKTGRLDVVVGTHRLLSKDVHFKDLGLLVVDEEQRFGVAHKERVQELRKTVDVLTLSATPIPRTLSLAIGGMRDMSVIGTAPVQRRAIRTFTSRFDEQLIRDAILRELERGGQVFYVYNRVEGIYERAALIQKLLPDVRVGVGHGKLSERQLERTMYGFVQGEFDVLCATAIVESGLDIPRANTMIVDRADLFGLSQLYQLRGRVGRSKERGYCYLLVPPDVRLSSEARARIETLERYTELGSGFHVATMDMELRGAGEFLGADQSGFMEKIGFELFAHMLEEATAELRGEKYLSEVDPELSLDIEALLPESYIDDIGVRLSLYKRLAAAQNEDEVSALCDEIADRFGRPPREALRYFEVMALKTRLRQIRALSLRATKTQATLVLDNETPLDIGRLVTWVANHSDLYRLSPDGRLKRTERDSARFESGLAHAAQLLQELSDLDHTGS